jgi:hypothetical protein
LWIRFRQNWAVFLYCKSIVIVKKNISWFLLSCIEYIYIINCNYMYYNICMYNI